MISNEVLEELKDTIQASVVIERALASELLQARQQLAAMADGVSKLDDYDAGYMNDYGGGNVGWWQYYIRSEVNRCNDFWRSQVENILPVQPEEG